MLVLGWFKKIEILNKQPRNDKLQVEIKSLYVHDDKLQAIRLLHQSELIIPAFGAD